MHDALRQRLLRRIESLPDQQVYQVLDFIEFLESKYAGSEPVEATGLQKFAESLEDKLRKKAVSPNTIREAFQLISAADRVLHGVSSAGKQILSDLNQALETPEGEAPVGEGGTPRPAVAGGASREAGGSGEGRSRGEAGEAGGTGGSPPTKSRPPGSGRPGDRGSEGRAEGPGTPVRGDDG